MPALVKVFASFFGLLFIIILNKFVDSYLTEWILRSIYIANILCIPLIVNVVYSEQEARSSRKEIFLTIFSGISILLFFDVSVTPIYVSLFALLVLARQCMDLRAVSLASAITSGLAVRALILTLLAVFWPVEVAPYLVERRSAIDLHFFIAAVASILMYDFTCGAGSCRRIFAAFFIGSDQFIRALTMWYVVERSGAQAGMNVLVLSILLIGNQLALISNFSFNQLVYSGHSEIRNKLQVLKLQVRNFKVIFISIIATSFFLKFLGDLPSRLIIDYGLIAFGLGFNILLGPIPLLLKDQGQDKIVIFVNSVALVLIIAVVTTLDFLGQTLMFQALAFMIINAARCAGIAIFFYKYSDKLQLKNSTGGQSE